MTRRQLLAALTGCAVVKPTSRPVVMVPKRYGMTQFCGGMYEPTMFHDAIVKALDEHIRQYGWEKYE